jgi:hypothetical protein
MSTFWYSGGIACNASADAVRAAIAGYFSSKKSSEISVTVTYYDANDVQINLAADSKKNIYKVSLKTRINGLSFSSHSIIPFGEIAPVVTIQPPGSADTTLSSQPLSGKMVISCPDK